MGKNMLNNLLSFKDFTGELPKNKQVKTKRTEVGIDVLNENFYDKLVFKVNNDRPLEATMDELQSRIVKAARTGQVSELDIDDGTYNFKILDKYFKLYCDEEACEMSIKTPRSTSNRKIEDWVTFEVPFDVADNITSALDDVDYL